MSAVAIDPALTTVNCNISTDDVLSTLPDKNKPVFCALYASSSDGLPVYSPASIYQYTMSAYSPIEFYPMDYGAFGPQSGEEQSFPIPFKYALPADVSGVQRSFNWTVSFKSHVCAPFPFVSLVLFSPLLCVCVFAFRRTILKFLSHQVLCRNHSSSRRSLPAALIRQ